MAKLFLLHLRDWWWPQVLLHLHDDRMCNGWLSGG